MRSNNPYAPPTGSEPALPEENVKAAHRVPRNGPVPVEPSAEGSDPAFPYGVPTPRTGDEKPVETLPPHISEAHADSEPTAPAPRAASPSAAAQRDRSSSPTAARPHATSTGTDPQDSSTPEDKSTKAFTLPIPTHVFAGLASVIAALFFTSIGMAQANDFGTAKLQWQFAACLFGLAAAGLCIPFIPATVRYTRILFTEGENESAETRASGYALICLVGLAAAVIAISNAVPAARDLIEGPHATTVSSCWLYQRPVKSSPTNTSPSSYRNEFNITLNDKSTLVLVIVTEKRDELQSASGISGTLYKGCELRPSSKKLVLDLYPRTQIIADARLV
ncbi:hypothetical protein [Schaalia dentiphila]|jgi:hypothetical protein|uniref:hypothetical protein n=1 Tax=Schaalia dentiphila TaxID=3050224 RepID=UPI001FCBA8E7|nr:MULTISPECIES: hypothetical protein [Schaalia]